MHYAQSKKRLTHEEITEKWLHDRHDLAGGFESADIVMDAALRSTRIHKILEITLTDL